MTMLTLGDLATSFQQRIQSARLRNDLSRLTDELSTGRTSDLRKATGGHLGALASLDHRIAALDSHAVAAKEAGIFAGALQTTLGAIQDATTGLEPTLARLASGALMAGGSGQAAWITAAADEMHTQFGAVLSTLNTHVAGRTLLGGSATSGPALADAETMLADLAVAVSGQTTAAGVEATVDAWFDLPGGGFETVGYLGSDNALSPFRIGQHETVDLGISAADQGFRDLLKGYAMAALVSDGALGGDNSEKAALLRTAGERMLTANDTLSNLRARVGSAEAAIDAAQARGASESSALQMARNGIVAADPFETAVGLEATQLQLEALYAVTARLSRLNLTEFLR